MTANGYGYASVKKIPMKNRQEFFYCVIADVSFSCPFFTSVFSDFLIFAKGGMNLIDLIINELRYLTKTTLAN